jgi:predicted nucleotidyltransferase
MISDSLKDEIIKKVSPVKLHKLILFGSHAYGDPADASDIDLLVVLNSEEMPRNYEERSSNYLEINRLLRDTNKKVSMDLMVMTKAQWEKFIELDSGFSKEIILKGIHLI